VAQDFSKLNVTFGSAKEVRKSFLFCSLKNFQRIAKIITVIYRFPQDSTQLIYTRLMLLLKILKRPTQKIDFVPHCHCQRVAMNVNSWQLAPLLRQNACLTITNVYLYNCFLGILVPKILCLKMGIILAQQYISFNGWTLVYLSRVPP
jgi:hypothetical protein